MDLPPFQAFLDEHRASVFRFLVALVGPQDAEDCFQETFLAALRAYPRADGRNLKAWAMTIAHRKAMDLHRGRKKRPVPVERVPDAAAPDAPIPDAEVWRDVVRLPEGQRAAVLLRYAEDLPYRDIGAVLGCSEAAARQRVREGLRSLREVVTT